MNSLPLVIENIIIDYKIDLDVIDNTNKKYRNVLKQLNNLIVDTDLYMKNWFDNCQYDDYKDSYDYNDYKNQSRYSHYLFTTMYCLNNF